MAFGKGSFRKSNKPKRKRTAPHNIADEFEREKHEKEVQKLLKHLNEDGTPAKPATNSQIMSILRGAIREKWMYSPTKLAYLKMHTVPDDDPTTRRRWKVQCEECEQWFSQSEVAVDHIRGENSLKSVDDLLVFYDNIINVGFDDIQILCHEDHDHKSMMERYKLTKEDAIVLKIVTSWEKKNPKADQQKEFLREKGYSAKEVVNAEKRRLTALDYFSRLHESKNT